MDTLQASIIFEREAAAKITLEFVDAPLDHFMRNARMPEGGTVERRILYHFDQSGETRR